MSKQVSTHIPKETKWVIFLGTKRYKSILPIPYFFNIDWKQIKLLKNNNNANKD
jgi:hypothetical protein